MTAPLYLIIAGDPKPTLRAIHDACSRAVAEGAAVAITQLVPVGNPVLLGDPHAYWSLTIEQQEQLDSYVEVVGNYGVRVFVQAMQMVNYQQSLVQLAELLNPKLVYLHAPKRGPAWWRSWNRRRLSSAFAARNCAVVWVDIKAENAVLQQSESQRDPVTAA